MRTVEQDPREGKSLKDDCRAHGAPCRWYTSIVSSFGGNDDNNNNHNNNNNDNDNNNNDNENDNDKDSGN